MPTIVIPPTVTLTDDEGASAQFEFVKNFIMRTALRDEQFGVNTEWLYAAWEIRGEFTGKAPGDRITLTEDQYSKLLAVVKKPSRPYHPQIMIECKSFVDAVLKAE